MTGSCCRTGKHVFHAFNDMVDAIAVAARFFATCAVVRDTLLFFGEEATASRIIDRLAPVTDQRTALLARFVQVPPQDVFTGSASSPVDGLIALRDRLVGEALAEHRMVRLVIMPAANAADAELWNRTDAFESTFIGRAAPPEIVTGLCMYDRRRYPPDLIELARAAHPWCIANGDVVRNAFHDAHTSAGKASAPMVA